MALQDMKTGQDVLFAVLADASQSASLSDDYADQAQRYVLIAYWDVLCRYRWPWAMSPTPGVITTVAKDTVSVSSISTATPAIVTLGAALTPTRIGRKFSLDGNQAIYRIAAHADNTALLTLDAGYVESETAGPGIIFQDEYDCPGDVLKIWDSLHYRGQPYCPITLLGQERFEAKHGRSWGAGPAPMEDACVIGNSATLNTTYNRYPMRLRVAPWSEDAANLEFDYTAFHTLTFDGNAATDTPRVPREFLDVLVDMALYKLWIGKDDTKANQAIVKAESTIVKMCDVYMPQQHEALYVKPRHSAALGCT